MVLRLLLLPAPGLADDIDQFVLWVHGIAIGGLPNAYDQNLSFPPVMAYIWGLLAALDPAFRTATDSSDLAVRVVMKLPATLADFGLAGLTGLTVSALRFSPAWAVAASARDPAPSRRPLRRCLVGPVRVHLPPVGARGDRCWRSRAGTAGRPPRSRSP